MEKRDLKADLEQLKRTKKAFEPQQVTFETPEDEIVPAIDILDQQLYTLVGLGKFAVKYGEEWLKRAIEAEELSRKLLKALKFFFKCLSNKDLVEPEPSHFLSLELSQIATLCHKVEEVLEDGITLRLFNRSNVYEGLSATKIREAILNEDQEYLEKYIPLIILDDVIELTTELEAVTNNPKEDFSM